MKLTAVTEMVRISVRKIGNSMPRANGVETVLFSDEYEMERDFITKIKVAKQNYINALSAYFDGILSSTSDFFKNDNSDFEKRRSERIKNKYIILYKSYMSILNNFTIDSYRQVTYAGNILVRSESVRRYTEIHIEELADIDQIKSVSVENAKKEYEELLKAYINVIRFIFD